MKTVLAVQTAGSHSLSSPGAKFNAFLWAPVWEDQDQTSLSVLSAFARLDLDAWSEASELAQLPIERAVERLASLIRRLPAGSARSLDPAAVAARLITLLPRPANAPSPPLDARGARMMTAMAAALIGLVISTTVVLSLDVIRASGQSPGPVAQSQAIRPPPPVPQRS